MEVWKDIIGYEGKYQVSNLGRIKSLARNIKGGHWNTNRWFSEKILSLCKRGPGYLGVCLCENDKKKTYLVHRIVLQAFVDNTGNKPESNHIDGNKHNNRVDNLEWSTRSDNEIHAYKMGLAKPTNSNKNGKLSGINHHAHKLTEEDVINIRKEYAMGNISQINLGIKYNINQSSTGRIIRKLNWVHI